MKTRKKLFFRLLIGIMFFAPGFSACTKNSAPSPALAEVDGQTERQTDDTESDAVDAPEALEHQPPEFPIIMYVNSKDGLRGREEPSTGSGIVRTFMYGQRLVITEKNSTPVTIDEITGYWYKTNFGDSDMWLFGGYLSVSFPSGAPALSGRWHFRNRTNEYGPSCEGADHYDFTPNGSYNKASNMRYVQLGKWRNEGNYVIIEYSEPIPDSMEWSSDEKMESVQVITENSDNINLVYHDGNKLELVRCFDPYARNW